MRIFTTSLLFLIILCSCGTDPETISSKTLEEPKGKYLTEQQLLDSIIIEMRRSTVYFAEIELSESVTRREHPQLYIKSDGTVTLNKEPLKDDSELEEFIRNYYLMNMDIPAKILVQVRNDVHFRGHNFPEPIIVRKDSRSKDIQQYTWMLDKMKVDEERIAAGRSLLIIHADPLATKDQLFHVTKIIAETIYEIREEFCGENFNAAYQPVAMWHYNPRKDEPDWAYDYVKTKFPVRVFFPRLHPNQDLMNKRIKEAAPESPPPPPLDYIQPPVEVEIEERPNEEVKPRPVVRPPM